MICERCGTENRAGRRFCRSCGAGLAASCPVLRRPGRARRPFCGVCGEPASGRRGPGPGVRAGSAAGADRSRSRRGRSDRAPARQRPVRRPRRLHGPLRRPRPGGGPGVPGRLLRARPGADRPLRRDDREVHRRRGHGRLGHARSPTRTTPSGRSGRPSTCVDAVGRPAHARTGRRSRPGRRCSPARRPSPSARTARGWSPATWSTPRRRLQSVGATRIGPGRRGDRPGARESAIAYEPAGEQILRGKAAPGRRPGGPSGWSPDAVGRVGRPGSRRRSWVATTSCGCSRSSSTRPPASGAPRLVSIARASPGSARAGSPGSSRSTSTGWSRSSTGTRAARRPMATGWRSGRWPRWSAGGPGSPSRTRPTSPGRSSPTMAAEYLPDPDERARVEPQLAALLGLGGAGRRSAEELTGGLAHALRADRRPGPDGPRVRGSPLGGPGPARLHRGPARRGPDAADPRRRPGPAGAHRRAARPWAPRSGTTPGSTSRRSTDEAMDMLLLGLVPGHPARRRCGRSAIGPRASRCMRSRPSGCCSTRDA